MDEKMRKLLIENLMKDLKTRLDDEVLDLFSSGVEYSKDWSIYDIISDVADNSVDIYNDDLLEWCKYNYTYVENAISEFGIATDTDNNPDFIKLIMQGQFYCHEQLFYNNLDEFILYYKLYYLLNNNVIEINENKLEDLQNTFCDNNSTLQDVIDEINDILEKNGGVE